MRSTRLALVVVVAALTGAWSCHEYPLFPVPESGLPSPIDLEGELCSEGPRRALARLWVLNLNLHLAPIACDEAGCPLVENFRVDSDGDAIPDDDEAERGTDPFHPDSDLDGITDGVELLRGTPPLAPGADCDGTIDTDVDGVTDCDEAALGLDPTSFATNGEPDILVMHAPLNAILRRVQDIGLVDEELCYDVTIRRVTLGDVRGVRQVNHVAVAIEFVDVDTGAITYSASTRLMRLNPEARPADGPIALEPGAVDGIQNLSTGPLQL